MGKWWGLAIGGVSGTIGRYMVAGWVHRALGTEFPYGTLAINASGCLIIGFLDTLAETRLPMQARVMLMTGFCGAYTTFSTFVMETAHSFRAGEIMRGSLNVGASVLLGLLLFELGVMIGRAV